MNRSTNANAPKSAAKTKVARAVPHAEDKPLFEDIMRRYEEAQDAMLGFFKAPSWKRTLCAFVTTIVVGCGIGWIAGTLLNWMITGAVMMAAPLFLVVAAYVLGAVATIWYGGKFACRIGGAVLTGEADERAVAAYDAIKSTCSRLWPFGKKAEVEPVRATRRAKVA